MKKVTLKLVLAVTSAVVAGAASASYEVTSPRQESWIVKGGLAGFIPQNKSFKTRVTDIDESKKYKFETEDSLAAALSLTWLATDSLGLQLATTTPARLAQKAELKDGPLSIGQLNYRQTSLTAQYYFNPGSQFQPYAGVGIAYNHFKPVVSSELKSSVKKDNSSANIAKTKIKGSTFSPVIEAGLDYNINSNWLLNTSLSYTRTRIEQNYDVRVVNADDSIKFSKYNFNPLVARINLGYRF